MYRAVILLLIAASSANQLPNGCPSDWQVHRLLPHETDCAKFYTCSHGQKILMECAPGTLFDANLQTCNWPSLVTCNPTSTQPTQSTPGEPPTTQYPTTSHPPTTQPPVACPDNVVEHQLLPHETNCSKFYQCSKKVLVLKECPDGLHFDINFQICNWPFMATCGTGTTTSSIQPSTTQPPMTQPPTTQPTTHPPATEVEFLPNGCPKDHHIHHLLPHEDCSKFYQCNFGSKVERDCAPGTLFDFDLQVCNHAYLVKCTPGSTGPTTHEPIVTEPITLETTTWEPTTNEPTTKEPATTYKPTTVVPVTYEPSEPTTTEPPTTWQPTTRDPPTTWKPTTKDPPTTWEPTTKEPSTTWEPTSIEPLTTWEPTTREPPTTLESTTKEPSITWEPTTKEPSTTWEPTTREPPTTWEPTTKEPPTTWEPTTKESPITWEPTTREPPATWEPTTKVPSTTWEPTTKEPPITWEPTTREPPATWEPTTREPPATWEPTTKVPATTLEPTTKEPSITWEPTTKEPATTWEPTTKEPPTTWEPTTKEPSTTWEPTTKDPITTWEPTTKVPSTGSPTDSTDSPTVSTDSPTDSTDSPTGSTGSPTDSTDSPTGSTGSPTDSTDSPTGSTGSPTDSTDSPTGSTGSPTDSTDSPTGSTDQSVDSSTLSTDQPTTKDIPTEESTTVTPPAQICSTGVFENVAHPTICNSFYMCAGGNAIQLFCSNGFEFDSALSTCVEIVEGGCTLGSVTTNAPTDGTTTELTSDYSPTDSNTVTTESPTDVPITDNSPTDSNTVTTESPTDVPITDNSPTDSNTVTTESPTDVPITDNSPTDSNTVTTESPTDVPITDNSPTDSNTVTTESPTDVPITDNSPTDSNTVTTESPTDVPITENSPTDSNTVTTESPTDVPITDNSPTDSNTVTTESPTDVPITDYSPTPSGLTTTEIVSTVTDSTTEVESTTTVAQLCPVDTILLVPNPERCDGYYMCTDAMAVPMYCEEGYEFDPDEQQCVVITEGGCTLGSSTDINLSPTTNSPATYTTENHNEVTTEEYTVTTEYNDKLPTEYTTEDGIRTTETTLNPIETTIVTETPADSESLITVDPIIVTEASTAPETTATEIETPTVTETLTETSVTTDKPITTTEAIELTTQNLATTSEVDSTTPAQLCPLGVMGNVANSERCDAYYMCAGGMAIPFFCATGFEFDPVLRTCVEIAEGGCTLGSSTNSEIQSTTVINLETTTASAATTNRVESTQGVESTTSEKVEWTTENVASTTEIESTTQAQLCPLGVMGNVANSERCDAYYMCAGGMAIPFFCATGFEFDPVLSTCVEIAEGGCTLGPIVETQTTTVNDLEVTAANVATTNGVESTESAESTTSEKVELTTENIAKTTEIETTTQTQLCPLGVMGNVANSERCDAYYMCAGGMAIPFFCATGFEFDPVLSTCVEIAEGGCTLGPIVETQTTTVNDLEITAANVATTNGVESTESAESTTSEKVALTTENVGMTTEVESTTQAQLCPLGVMGNVANSERCDAYYMCAGGMAIPFYCATGFEFDPVLSTCVEIAEGGCTLTIKPTTDGRETTDNEATTKHEVETTTVSQICPVGVMGNVSSPDSCSAYFMCVEGAPIPLFCGSGFEFDPMSEGCIPIVEGGCTLQSNTDSEEAKDPIKEESSTYKENIPIQTTTEVPTTVYEKITEADVAITEVDPDEDETVEEVETTTKKELCPLGSLGNVANPVSCYSYYMCAGGMAIPQYCAEGFEFDPVQGRCVAIAEGGCTLALSHATAELTLRSIPENISTVLGLCEGDGSRADPNVCDSFYVCANGKAIRMHCDFGYEYSAEAKKCEPFSERGCTVSRY